MGLKSALFGSHDSYDDFLDVNQRNAAKVGLEQRGRVLSKQDEFLSGLSPALNQVDTDIAGLSNLPSPEQQANVEVERRRRALGLGQENLTRNLNRGIARRGLQGSAAGLFQAQNQNRDFQNSIADLESSRLGLQNNFYDQNLARRGTLFNQRGNLTGQFGNIVSGMQLPGIDYGARSTGGLVGKVGGAIGGMLGKAGGSFASGVGRAGAAYATGGLSELGGLKRKPDEDDEMFS